MYSLCMKIVVTVEELMRAFCWFPLCKLRGISPFALNEGQVNRDDEFILSLEEVREIGMGDTVARAIAATWPQR